MGFRAQMDGPGRPKADFTQGQVKRGPIASFMIPAIQIFVVFCVMRIAMLQSNMFVFVNIPFLDSLLRDFIAVVVPFLENNLSLS